MDDPTGGDHYYGGGDVPTKPVDHDERCAAWEDGRHSFVLMREVSPHGREQMSLVAVQDPMKATHKLCVCGLVVPRADT